MRLPQSLLAGAATAAFLLSLGTSASAADPVRVCGYPDGRYPNITVDSGNYQAHLNEWNDAAYQAGQNLCIAATGGSGFGVEASTLNSPNGQPAAYPNIGVHPDKQAQAGFPARVDTLGDTTSSWSTVAGTGTYNSSYDIWYADNAADCSNYTTSYELMVWLNRPGGPQPIGGAGQVQATVGGTAYTASLHQPDGNVTQKVISYIRNTPTTSVYRLNLREFTQDAVMRGYAPANGYLCKVEAGFEIWRDGNGLKTTSFSYSPKVGLPTGHLASGLHNRCLSWKPGASPSAVTAACSVSADQNWAVANDGSIHIAGKCLDNSASHTNNGNPVKLYDCNGSAAQKWRPDANRSLVNLAAPGKCLDIPSGGLDDVQLQIWTCNGTASQQWSVPQNGAGTSTGVTSKPGGLCLANQNDQKAVIATCGDAGTQTWNLGADGTERIQINGRCLGTAGVGNGSLATVGACDGSPAQRWIAQPGGWISNPASGRCLDDPAQSMTPGTQVQIYDCNGSDAQVWWSALT
ncbi:MAG: ricin-type beta-trefoil lectin domain protein [Streptosporangiaceae bacterium]